MNKVYTSAGYVEIGDFVSVYNNSVHDTINGIVRGISKKNDGISVEIYITDNTGGYTIQVSHLDILSVISKLKEIELKTEDLEKPKRYNKRGKLECWDVILDQQMNFLEGNIVKYVWRYKEKNGVEDLKKAKIYLEKLISEIEKV